MEGARFIFTQEKFFTAWPLLLNGFYLFLEFFLFSRILWYSRGWSVRSSFPVILPFSQTLLIGKTSGLR